VCSIAWRFESVYSADCCDGSDEYDGKAQCTNTCSELGKVWRDKLRKKISTFKIGLEVRNRDVARSKLMIQKDKLDLANLKVDEKKLKAVVKQLGGIYIHVFKLYCE
jgi:protein kinase C substrate 80K-H